MNREQRRRQVKSMNSPEKIQNFAATLERNIRAEYEKKYQKDLLDGINLFILTIIYTLHFNEKTNFGNKRIQDFMDDLLATVDMFRTGEYNPEEYREALKKDGILIRTSERNKK